MQAIKNGIKSTLRTPVKSLLFVVLLTGLAVLLCVSFCVFGAVTGYIKDANSYFHTIAELEFMGEEYPDRTVYDESVNSALSENSEALSALVNSDAVMRFEPEGSFITVIDGFWRKDGAVYNSKAAVLEVCIMSYDEANNMYQAVVSKSYYSLKKMQDKLVSIQFVLELEQEPEVGPDGNYIIDDDREFPKLETGKHYIMAGVLVRNYYSAGELFLPEEISFTDGGELCTTPFCTETEAGNAAEQELFLRLAEILNVQNNGCRVTYTNAIEDTVPFHQSMMRMKSGRLFTAEEYESGAKVCVVSSRITGMLELDVGDTLDMSVFSSETDLYDPSSLVPVDSGQYEIIGIFYETENYPCHVFLPGLEEKELLPVTGYTLGRFLLKNELTEGFLRQAEPLIEKGFRIAVYDQGYSAAIEPMRELQFISIIFLAVTLLLAVVTLLLQSHLFVSRQRDAAQTMDKLGSGKTHICLYFLSSALLLSLIGAGPGILISKLIESRVFALMQRFATQFAEQDLRFSYTRLAEIRTLEFAPTAGIGVYAAAAAALILGSLIFTLAFAVNAPKDRNAKKRVKRARAVTPTLRGSTSKLSGPLKYAALSMRRGLVRTLAVLLVCAAAAVFFCRLATSLDGYREQLERYKASAVITGYGTDYYGRSMDKLALRPTPMIRLIESGEADTFCATNNLGYCTVVGVGIRADGTRPELDLSLPASEFGRESLAISLTRERPVVSTPSIERSPQFRASGVEIDWLEGYEESFSIEYKGPVCALSERTMREYGIELGDAVMLLACYTDVSGKLALQHVLLKVVASYSSSSTTKTVFVRLNRIFPISFDDPYTTYEANTDLEPAPEDAEVPTLDTNIGWMLEGFEEDRGTVEFDGHTYEFYQPETTLSSFTFKLSDTSRLDELRDALYDCGFTWVRSGERLKNFAVIDDGVYLNTTHSMQRQIQYVSALYYSLYAAAFIIAAALAWLLTHSRRPEIAVQRALGAQKTRIFFNFFMEQGFLCAAGLGLGLAVSHLLPGGVPRLALILCAAFLGLWCVFAMICLLISLKGRETSLSEKE